MIHVSIGTLGVLGLRTLRADAQPTTAYLMTPGKCAYNCTYCSRAHAMPETDKLSRVTWPQWDEDDVFRRLRTAYETGRIQRACIQVVNHANAVHDAIRYVEEIRRRSPIPISVSLRTGNVTDVDALVTAGADRVCLPIDTVDDRACRDHRRGTLKAALRILEAAARRYPGKISTHIMVGLGETEQQVVDLLQWLHVLRVVVGLFAFTPIKGTPLEQRRRPSIRTYRRIQIAHHLISHAIDWDFEYDAAGEIINLDDALSFIDGSAFRTRGCPDCNRPFYNERPGGRIYNYPSPLSHTQFESEITSHFSTSQEKNPIRVTE
jgi:biotin synthase